jgi:hypothetical protein
VAAFAVAHLLDGRLERAGKPLRALAIVLKQVERHALRRLDADTRQPPQRLDQPFE